jgi:peroxiredoxin
MTPTLTLFAALWAAGQPADGDRPLAPRLGPGQELLYRGSFTEEGHDPSNQFRRAYDLETRAFVLKALDGGFEVAILTLLRDPHAPPGTPPGSVRLATVTVDVRGRVTLPPGTAAPTPLDGPPTLEVAAVTELPPGPVGVGQSWDVMDGDRPPRTWRVTGTEAVNGVRCFKLVGTQQTADWDRPGSGRSAWKRQDVVWLRAQQAVVQRVERTVEQRAPGRGEPGQRSVTAYELDGVHAYPGRLDSDRRNEITRAGQFGQTLTTLLARPDASPRGLAALQTRIEHHLQNQPATPYRDAILWVQRRAEAGPEAEVIPVARPAPVAPAVATLGQPAPDFVAADLTTREPVRLGRWQGRPVVLLFYRPDSDHAEPSLRCLQELQNRYGPSIQAAVLCVTGDTETALRQRAELALTVPVLAGREVQALYVTDDSTPRWVVLDAAGVVRYLEVGWGSELPALLRRSLDKEMGQGEKERK